MTKLRALSTTAFVSAFLFLSQAMAFGQAADPDPTTIITDAVDDLKGWLFPVIAVVLGVSVVFLAISKGAGMLRAIRAKI